MKLNDVISLNAPGAGDSEVERSKPFRIADTLNYVTNSIVIKTILRKTTGHITSFAFDAGEEMAGAYSPFDNLVQILEGKASITINDTSYMLQQGESIIIPAHARNNFKAAGQFKMLSTFIKSGYEDIL